MVRKLSTETRDEIKMYQANDYDLAEETTEYILMQKNTATAVGHIIVLFFFWWTLGIGNLIYHFSKNKKRKIMK